MAILFQLKKPLELGTSILNDTVNYNKFIISNNFWQSRQGKYNVMLTPRVSSVGLLYIVSIILL